MAELKTKPTKTSVLEYLKAIRDAQKRTDSLLLLKIFKEATGLKPVLWGDSMVGYGLYHYQSQRSSQKGDWPLIGFSPRKQNLTLYIMPGFKKYGALLEKLGKHKTSAGCLYIKKLADVDIKTLTKLIARACSDMQKKYSA